MASGQFEKATPPEGRSDNGVVPKALNADSVTPIAPPRAAVPTTRNMLYVGFVTGVTAALVCLALRIIGWIFRVDFMVAGPGQGELKPVPWLLVALVPLAVGVLGSLAAASVLGVKRCQSWVFWTGTVLFIVSLWAPLVQPDGATWPTRIFLALMHLVTYVIVVPQVARVVGDSDPRWTTYFREIEPGSNQAP